MEEYASFVNYIATAGQLAAALEACGWPKPGNVHRTADFEDTRFEHFIAGSISIGPALREAAENGVKASLEEISIEDIAVGASIKRAVSNVERWHGGGNTHLGVSMLLVPLSAAAGLSSSEKMKVEAGTLRRCVAEVMEATSVKDAVEVYEAVQPLVGDWVGVVEPGEGPPGLGDREARAKLLSGGFSLHDVMAYASSWDDVARELTTGMQRSFEVGYPTAMKVFEEHGDVNVATVHTFLTLLSRHPDTFIARKVGTRTTSNIREAVELGRARAREVSKRAGEVLRLGGLLTPEGRRALWEFDRALRVPGDELNPGTTADITASSLMIAVLCGLRP